MDTLFESMQTPEARAAIDHAFHLSSAEIGKLLKNLKMSTEPKEEEL